MRWGILVCVFVGCSDPRGVYIEVSPGTTAGITSVELFLGEQPCMDPSVAEPCAITPASHTDSLHAGAGGGSWYRDGDQVFRAPVRGGVAGFQIEPTDMQRTLQVVAVGTNDAGTAFATGVLHDLVIPDHGGMIQTTLSVAKPADNTEEELTPHPDGDYVQVWNNPASSCVVAEHWANGVAARTFVVPTDDADCDGNPTLDPTGTLPNPNECDPLWWDRTKPFARIDDSDCATKSSFVGNAATCVLGGPPCIDGMGVMAGHGCAPTGVRTCLPAGICSTCATPTSGSAFEACLGTSLQTQVHCTIYSADVGTPCALGGMITAPTLGAIDVSALFSSPHSCTSVRFANADSLANLAPQPQLTLPSASAMIDATIGPQMPCRLDLKWTAGLVPLPYTGWKMIDLAVDNGNHILLPARFTSSVCATTVARPFGIDCYLVASSVSETITDCAR